MARRTETFAVSIACAVMLAGCSILTNTDDLFTAKDGGGGGDANTGDTGDGGEAGGDAEDSATDAGLDAPQDADAGPVSCSTWEECGWSLDVLLRDRQVCTAIGDAGICVACDPDDDGIPIADCYDCVTSGSDTCVRTECDDPDSGGGWGKTPECDDGEIQGCSLGVWEAGFLPTRRIAAESVVSLAAMKRLSATAIHASNTTDADLTGWLLTRGGPLENIVPALISLDDDTAETLDTAFGSTVGSALPSIYDADVASTPAAASALTPEDRWLAVLGAPTPSDPPTLVVWGYHGGSLSGDMRFGGMPSDVLREIRTAWAWSGRDFSYFWRDGGGMAHRDPVLSWTSYGGAAESGMPEGAAAVANYAVAVARQGANRVHYWGGFPGSAGFTHVPLERSDPGEVGTIVARPAFVYASEVWGNWVGGSSLAITPSGDVPLGPQYFAAVITELPGGSDRVLYLHVVACPEGGGDCSLTASWVVTGFGEVAGDAPVLYTFPVTRALDSIVVNTPELAILSSGIFRTTDANYVALYETTSITDYDASTEIGWYTYLLSPVDTGGEALDIVDYTVMTDSYEDRVDIHVAALTEDREVWVSGVRYCMVP